MRRPSPGEREPDNTPRAAWRRAVAIADGQGGAISYRQMLDAGVSRSAVGRRIAREDLYPRHDGVHALGRPRLDPYGEHWAAALAAGDRGVLARWSAAAAMGLAPWPPVPEIVVVGGGLSLKGVRVYRTRSLPADEVYATRAGLRFTWWPRMTTDLAACSSIAELHTVLDRLDQRGWLDLEIVDDALRRARGRAGLRTLRTALEPFTTLPDADFDSLLERFGAMTLARAGVSGYEVNGRVQLLTGAVIRVDLLFRSSGLAVELDGRESHGRPSQAEIDRQRDRELQKLGIDVLRFHWADVVHRPTSVLNDIVPFLGPTRVVTLPTSGTRPTHEAPGGGDPARCVVTLPQPGSHTTHTGPGGSYTTRAG